MLNRYEVDGRARELLHMQDHEGADRKRHVEGSAFAVKALGRIQMAERAEGDAADRPDADELEKMGSEMVSHVLDACCAGHLISGLAASARAYAVAAMLRDDMDAAVAWQARAIRFTGMIEAGTQLRQGGDLAPEEVLAALQRIPGARLIKMEGKSVSDVFREAAKRATETMPEPPTSEPEEDPLAPLKTGSE